MCFFKKIFGNPVAANNDKELLKTFIYLHNGAWNDPSYGNAPIKHGPIKSILPLN